jgi:hypothetical protein
MLAASVDQQIIFAIAAAAYGVFVWWNDRRKKKESDELEKRIQENQTAGDANAPTATPPQDASEQDRLRRFLEALGVPGGQPPPPARPAPPPKPVQPAPAPRPLFQPAPPPPPVIPRPVYTSPRTIRPAPKPLVVYSPEPEPMESREAGHLETASAEMQRAAHYKATELPKTTAPATVTRRAQTLADIGLRESLRSPESLRAAILVREILGPPKGLEGF